MRRLDPAYRAVYPDGSELHIRADMADLREEIRTKVGDADAAGFDRFLVWLEQLYETEFATFVDHNYSSPLDLVRSPATAARLLRLGGLGALGPAVDRFFTDDRLTRIFSFQALYAGIAPAKARAVLAVITYMDTVRGVFYPEGGMHAVPRGMAQALDRRRRAGAPGRRGERGAAPLRRRRRRGRHRRRRAARRGCRGVHRRPARRLRPPAARASPRPERCAPAPSRPSAVVWHVGASGHPGAAPAPPQHPLRRRLGRRLRGDHRPRRADARPVAPGHRADRHRPHRRARRLDRPCTCWNRCRTPVPAWTGAARPARCASACTPSSRPAATPPTSARSCSSRPTTGAPRACTSARRSPWPTRSCSPGRSGPSNVDRRVPGLVFAGSGTQPGRRHPHGAGQRQARGAAGAGVRRGRPAGTAYGGPVSAATPVDAARGARLRAMPGAPQITREHGTTYYWGARLLPAESRRHVHAVYTLARLADDIVDLAGPTPARRPPLALDAFERSFWVAAGHRHLARPGHGGRRDHGARVRHRRRLLRALLRRDAHRPHPPHATRRGATCWATWTAAPPSSAR